VATLLRAWTTDPQLLLREVAMWVAKPQQHALMQLWPRMVLAALEAGAASPPPQNRQNRQNQQHWASERPDDLRPGSSKKRKKLATG